LGVLGALVFRAIFIAAGAALLEQFAWVLYVFAALLILTGIQMVRTRNTHSNPADGRLYRWLIRRIRTTDKLYGQRLFVRIGAAGAVAATPLFIALALVELTDIVFAVDSIPAIFGVTQEVFLVFTANAFAILGLRAMYFLLADLVHRFQYLKLGLAAILIWVGAKMALHDVVKIDTAVSLGVIVLILLVAIGASLAATRGTGRKHVTPEHAGHYEEATAAERAAATTVFTRKALT
ncbi:MAG: TerC/Alx family metal homeostasis membrane protein, partial [Agromyces sp.]